MNAFVCIISYLISANEYGLFRVEDEDSKCVWMENGRSLEYYLVRNQDRVEYKKKIRHLKVGTRHYSRVFVD